MPGMRDIKRRINSVRSTQQITKAMKMVAAANLRKAQANLLAARPYTDELVEVMGRLTGAKDESYTHPLLEERAGGKVIYVVLAADRGLCGGYNHSIIRKTTNVIQADGHEDIALVTVGRRGKEYFRRRNYELLEDYVDLGDIPDFIQARELARAIMSLYDKEHLGKVNLAYTGFKSAISQKPTVVQLLPVKPPVNSAQETADVDYIYEPGEREVLDTLLPRYVETLVYRAVLEAKASEHGARMVAMDNATGNAEEMIAKLILSFNRARQAAITREISEIVGGADALG